MKQTLLKSALCLCLLLTACNNQPEEAKKEGPTISATPEKSAPATAVEPQKSPAPAAEPQTAPAPEAAAKQDNVITGKVMETMDSAGYTYLLVDTGKAQQWVAIPETKVKSGDEVSYHDGMVMPNFTSKSLNRTFESVIFSPGLVGQGPPPATEKSPVNPHGNGGPMSNSMPAPHGQIPAADKAATGAASFADAVNAETPAAMQAKPESGGSMGAMAPFTEVKVEKAAGENGYTVAEIFADNTKLEGKTVRIQGKVVKFSSNIMGRNWIHLQDGSGDPLTNTHDLVITTNAQPPKDKDVITIEGIVRANKDFGAGYSYTALVEEAKIIQ
jgi:starvation-inducible outer membrane lipoprotein